MRFDAFKQRFEPGVIESAKYENLRAREESTIELEGRVLRCCSHQHNRAVLHHRKKTVLLAAVEAMDFIDEQKRALSCLTTLACSLERFLQIGDAGKHCR